ncbi:FRG domain-containing protein [Chachezhania antarctica]|uniref:FRG domain-containing protein n=1 Tax=Chachezhania antarctica TaxID=2340860 RepID=UPI000EAEBF83|nr:FRG domain-containing protein [Chachezhania antarctica]
MSDIAISKIGELSDEIAKIKDEYDGPLWYRGHGNAAWALIPGYYRTGKKVSEHSLLIKFRQSATMLVEKPPIDSFDWLFLMQHYGVPTRLLDWTESPLVALYFCVNSEPNEEGAIWALKPSNLNRIARIHAKDDDGFIPSFQDEELTPYKIENMRGHSVVELPPVATIASRNNPRIQAQLGAFTIHHIENNPIESLGDRSHVARILVSAEAKAELRTELELLGFTKFQMFPELASVGDLIRESLK